MNILIEFSDGTKTPLYITDDTHNFATCLTMVGRNIEQFGATVWTGFLNLLENYANSKPPLNPVEGQLWYDTVNKKLMINVHRHIGYSEWVECVKTIETPEGLLLKTGGTLYANNIVKDINHPNSIVNKKYVDENSLVRFENSETPYQYNMDTFNGFITINGRIEYSKFSSGVFEVIFGKLLNDGYSVTLSLDGIYKPKIQEDVSLSGKSGGAGITENEYDVSGCSNVSVWYDMYNAPDRMKIFINGELVKDTDSISGQGEIKIPDDKITSSCKLKIVMEGPDGTAWDYKLNYKLPPKTIPVDPFVYDYNFYVTNKTSKGFTIVISEDFPDTCNINFNVIGMVAK